VVFKAVKKMIENKSCTFPSYSFGNRISRVQCMKEIQLLP